jgi:hypothetical protein
MNTSKHTHPVNVSYLVVGLVFLGIAGSWALGASGVVDSGDSRWLVPLVLVGAGVAGLVAFAAKGVGGRRAVDDDPETLARLEGEAFAPYPVHGLEDLRTPDTRTDSRTDSRTDTHTPTETPGDTQPTTRLDTTEGDAR